MIKAIWNGAVLAQSERCAEVEGNAYFPHEAIRWECLEKSEARTVCAWKGVASYYDLVIDGRRNPQAAWFYAEPKPAAAQIKDHLAFWRGVRIEGWR